MANLFKVGMVGAGTIGQVHAKALQNLETAELLAVAEPREEAGRALADANSVNWYASYVDMLEQPEIDVVILGTPSGLHPEQTILAAQAGKHVITEKPMAITRDGASRMIDATDKAGVRLAVIFQNRISADVFKVKRAIEAGRIGTPLIGTAFVYWKRTQDYYDANGGWRGTWAMDGGGVLINQSIHMIDALQWIMGGVESVQAHTATLTHDIEAEDTASASVRFISGGVGAIVATTSSGQDHPTKIEIVGSGGRVVLENNAVTFWDGEGELSDDLLTEHDRGLVGDWRAGEAFGVGHQRQLRLIFDALASGQEPPFPGREARKAVDVILGIYESAQTGRRVDIQGAS
ncbi:MAG TPA: Gfo/Idh/MocA family oxidoreductase [Thermomicrobiales bacterium]|nr:Gfo/Idh/MocA family oxidoreductase [Thermomicrobiales bacterium]